jgi:hypothetical protein
MAAVVAAASAALLVAAPDASAGFTQTQATNQCIFQQGWETTSAGTPYINTDKGLCRIDITWGDTPDMCPRGPGDTDGRGGTGAYQKHYYRTEFDVGVIAGGNLVSGGPDLPRLWTGTLGVYGTSADLYDEVDGEKLIGIDEWKLKLTCHYGPDLESAPLSIQVLVRGPDYEPPAGGGGATEPPASGPPAPQPPAPDPACDRDNAWGLDAAARRERRRLAELFMLNAWDGQRLAEDLDLFGLLLKALAADEGAGTAAAKRTIETAGGLLAQEADLANRQADLEMERRLAITERSAAARRMQRAQGKAERRAARRDFDRADAALSRAQRRLADVSADLRRLRGNLGDVLKRLARSLADTEAGRALGSFLRVFNVAQDAAAAWMVVNAATAAILNRQAQSPAGCDEGWTKRLPGPGAAASAAVGAAAQAGTGASAAAGAGKARRVRTAALGRVRPGPFLPRSRAKAVNRALDALEAQVRAALALERGAGRAPGSRAARTLARALERGPARLRGLVTALDLDGLPATPQALRRRHAKAGARALRAEIRRLGAGGGLVPLERQGFPAPAPGELVDPFARFADPALGELARAAASALRQR